MAIRDRGMVKWQSVDNGKLQWPKDGLSFMAKEFPLAGMNGLIVGKPGLYQGQLNFCNMQMLEEWIAPVDLQAW